MNIQKSKLKKLSLAVAIGLMANILSVPFISSTNVASADTTQTEKKKVKKCNGDKCKVWDEHQAKEAIEELKKKAENIMGTSGTLPILGSTAKYSWHYDVPGVKVYPICTGTKAPSQNEEVSFNCVVVGENAYGASIPIRGVASGGKESFGGIAPFMYLDKTDSKKPIRRTGVMSITININAYQGKTTIGGSNPWDDFGSGGVDPYNNSTNWADGDNSNSTWYDPTSSNNDDLWSDSTNSKGSSLCPDGTYYCSSSSESNSLFGNNDNSSGYWGADGLWHNPDGTTSTSPGGSTSGGYYDENSVWHNADGTTGENGYYDKNGIWHNSDESSPSGTNTYDSNSNSNYGNILDKLLNDDSSSYNSGDSDWASSNGGNEGSNNLDDYFNGAGDSTDGLDGVTEDLLGVDEELMKNVAENSDAFNSDGFGEATATDAENWSDGSDLSDNASVWDGDSDSLQDLMNAMDGISGDGSLDDSDGTNDSDSDNSLMGSLSKFLKSIGGPETGVVGADVTDQEMFEIAKKLLMANGISLDDILAGKTYDKGSAYTEPRQAWDMNRITTLLGKGKIKVKADSSDVKNSHSSITSASNRNKAINTNLKK